MKNSVKKIEKFGNKQISLTDRGTFMGYNMLVNDEVFSDNVRNWISSML